MMGLGKTKKDKKKKQKKAKSGGGGLLKNLFGKNKSKKEKKKKKNNSENKMAKKSKKAEKKKQKADNKAAKKQSKATAKTEKKTAQQAKKASKAVAKAEKKANKQQKQRNFDLENAINTATLVKDAVAQNVPGVDKYLNVNKNNDEEYMDNEVNSSGEMNTASAEKKGFFSEHKGLLIGGGIVLTALIGAALIIRSRKSATTATNAVNGVGTLKAIDLS
jgi:flagellar biosynthesis GTPase FlhF